MYKLYPDFALGRLPRLLGDAAAVLWMAAWVTAGWVVYRTVIGLQSIGDSISQTGHTFNSWISTFRNSVAGLPFIGDALSQTADSLQRNSGDQLVSAGSRIHTGVGELAVVLAVVTAVPPLVMVVMTYGRWRYRDARERGAALAFVQAASLANRSEPARALLAYRAIASLSFLELMRVTPDPVGDITARNFERLAGAMLRREGLSNNRLMTPPPQRAQLPPPAV